MDDAYIRRMQREGRKYYLVSVDPLMPDWAQAYYQLQSAVCYAIARRMMGM